ncbi:methyltransferase domain-containing protein [Spirosoma arcticum]
MLLIDAANVSGGGAVLLQCLTSQLLRRQVPFHVLKKSSVVLSVPVQNYTNVNINLLNRWATLGAFIRRVNPTTLLCFGNFPPPFKTHVRTITYVHNLHYLNGHDDRPFGLRDKVKRNLRRTYLRSNLGYSDVFVVQTPYVQQLFVETFGVAPSNVHVLPFYDEDRIRAVADAQPTDGAGKPWVFLYASGSEPHKNHINLLRAWQLLHQQGISPILYLTISPESPYTTPTLLRQIETLKQSGVRVENLGYVPYDDLLRLTASCTACMFPSVNETVGLGLLEAYWLGNAVLAGRRLFLTHVVKPSIQFDPYNPADIADAVKQYLEGMLPKPELILRNQIDEFIQLLHQPVPNVANVPSTGENAVDFYNAIATQFDSKYESSAAFVERFRIWTDLFNQYVKATDNVMDIGCGSGVFSNYLAQMGCSVIGVDGSAEMIKLCNQKKKLDKAHYVLQSLPIPNPEDYEAQDVIIASSLLEYIGDIGRMLQQIHAMLKPNGLLIVSMPNQLSLYRRIERRLFALTGHPRYFAYIRHVSTEINFNQQLTDLGFEVLETKHFSGYDPLSRILKRVLPLRYVNNLFVGVYRKRK